MALMKINGKQIQTAAITDEHINGLLSESKLNIDFASHSDEILDKKIIVDSIQSDANPTTASGTIELGTKATMGDMSTGIDAKGVVVEPGRAIVIRDSTTGEPLVVNDGNDIVDATVYGVITESAETYTLNYKVRQYSDNAEVAYVLTTGDVTNYPAIDIIYFKRFSLSDVSENFANNTRFVDGAADVTAHLNDLQLSKDVFGASYNTNADGEFSDVFGNGNSFVQEVDARILTATVGTGDNTDKSASEIIDEVVLARGVSIDLVTELARIETKILIESEVDARVTTLVGAETTDATAGTELIGLKTGTNTAYEKLSLVTGDKLEDALVAMIADTETNATNLASADAAIHKHTDISVTAIAAATEVTVTFPGDGSTDYSTPYTTDYYQIYVNGNKQIIGSGVSIISCTTQDLVIGFAEALDGGEVIEICATFYTK